ncbi:taste receptor type 1 member 3 [Ornithorhynchus anatinus]|uniref:taste receptor type 1 member 3 n=1 Tax=Ornithorhynchus anatinus TaxID=9258 RepID=UPI0019D4DC9C|nr:taste receptor type 1 member 3 [Ornithorhynchus anatinus]
MRAGPSPRPALGAAPALLATLFSGLSGAGPGAQASHCPELQERLAGDYMLGGLFPFSTTSEGLLNLTKSGGLLCSRPHALRFPSALPRVWSETQGGRRGRSHPSPVIPTSSPLPLGSQAWPTGLLWALAMMLAVEEINNSSSLLPGVRLGYELHNTCTEPREAMRPSLLLLSGAGESGLPAACNYTLYQPRAVAVIGPHSSDLALVTGKLFSFFLIPQVSYGATSERLSNRASFPSFFRTVSSDRHQLQAVMALLNHFHWNWVAAVGSDDEYGRQGLNLFSSLAASQNICVAIEVILPDPGAQSGSPDEVRRLLDQMDKSRIRVVVLFATDVPAYGLLHGAIQGPRVFRVWVASEAWLLSRLVSSLQGIWWVGTVLGFAQRGAEVPGFGRYVAGRLSSAQNPSRCPAAAAVPPGCPLCGAVSLENVSAELHHQQSFSVYSSVYSVAHGLHKALGCTASRCQDRTIRPWQLLNHMKNLNFSAGPLEMQFDSAGTVEMGYNLLQWTWRGGTFTLKEVGSFQGQLVIDRSQIQWQIFGNQEPVSQCSSQCEEGQIRRVKGFHSCCYDCLDCKAGTYRRERGEPGARGHRFPSLDSAHPRVPQVSPKRDDDLACLDCQPSEWSPPRSTRCFPRTDTFLAWGDPAAVGLVLLLLLELTLAGAALLLFCRHLGSPVVEAAGGRLACLSLLALALAAAGALLFPGPPTARGCLAQQPLFLLPLTACLTAMWLKASELFLGSEWPALVGPFRRALRGGRAWLAVALGVLAEGALCAGSIVAFLPRVTRDTRTLPTQTLILCRGNTWVGFGIMHALPATLAFGCFLGTFLTHQPGPGGGLARGLTFAALTYFATWVCFVPVHANAPRATWTALQMGAQLLCVLGLLASFYLPRCYVLLHPPAQSGSRGAEGAGPGSGEEEAR